MTILIRCKQGSNFGRGLTFRALTPCQSKSQLSYLFTVETIPYLILNFSLKLALRRSNSLLGNCLIYSTSVEHIFIIQNKGFNFLFRYSGVLHRSPRVFNSCAQTRPFEFQLWKRARCGDRLGRGCDKTGLQSMREGVEELWRYSQKRTSGEYYAPYGLTIKSNCWLQKRKIPADRTITRWKNFRFSNKRNCKMTHSARSL